MSEHIRVPVRDSRMLLLAVLFSHAVACAGLFLSGAQPWIQLCGCAALVASAALCIGGTFRAGRSGSVLDLSADRSCAISGNRDAIRGLLRADSVALPWLVVLRIDCGEGRGTRAVVLMPDSANADDWRRLRVFLRWGVRFAGAAARPSGGPS